MESQESPSFVFVPSACKSESDEPAEFSGSITLRTTSFDERMGYAELTADAREIGSQKAWFGVLRELAKKSADHYVSVDIRHKSGKLFSSFSEMALDSRCDGIIIEIAKGLVDGFDLGNG